MPQTNFIDMKCLEKGDGAGGAGTSIRRGQNWAETECVYDRKPGEDSRKGFRFDFFSRASDAREIKEAN